MLYDNTDKKEMEDVENTVVMPIYLILDTKPNKNRKKKTIKQTNKIRNGNKSSLNFIK